MKSEITSSSKTKEQLFIGDLISALLEQVERAQEKVIQSKGTVNEGFHLGIVQGYWQVLTSLVARLQIHDIDLSEYELEGYDPDTVWVKIRENLSTKP